jgi:hypothetical protein
MGKHSIERTSGANGLSRPKHRRLACCPVMRTSAVEVDVDAPNGSQQLPPEIWEHVMAYLDLSSVSVATLLELMRAGICSRVKDLHLATRNLGPMGAAALAERIRARACPLLEEVS